MRRLNRIAAALAARDYGSFVRAVHIQEPPRVGLAYTWLGLGPLLAAFVLAFRDRFVFPTARDAFVKRTHVLPIALQALFFAYWSLYWPQVDLHLPSLVAQLLFAYTLDVLFAWWLRRGWPGLFAVGAPVLSANLFVWFTGDDLWMSFLLITAAIASKALIRRDGRHIFNPSAFGASVVALLVLSFPNVFHHSDIAFAISSPPNMSEVMFVATLVPLTLLATAPIAVGAAVGMQILRAALRGGPSFTWPGWFLTVTIFAGDPATSPRTSAGRFLFGLFVGAAIQITAFVLNHTTGIDFWAKVLPIPVANLLSDRFDAAGGRVARRFEEFLKWLPSWAAGALRRPVLIWSVLFLVRLFNGKSGGFARAFHREWNTPIVRSGPSGEIECASNRAFCEPFRFDLEIAAWMDRRQIAR